MATIYDVAQFAKVSIKTVSRVLNDEGPVGFETRERVLRAIKSLDYTPSNAARTMRTQKTDLIGVITNAITSAPTTPEMAGLPSINLVKGIQSVIDSAGKLMMIADTGNDSGRAEELARTFREHRVEGMLFVADYHQEVKLPPSFNGIPGVLVNCFDESQTLPAIVPDDMLGGYRAVETAFRQKHRRIGFLTLAPESMASQLRTEGYCKAHQDLGISLDRELIIPGMTLGGSSEADLKLLTQGLDQLLRLDPPPTIICCGNDRMAMSLYQLLQQRQIMIPEQISVIGFDDYSLISEVVIPRLTTVALPYIEMGKRGAKRLLDLIIAKENRTEPRIEKLIGSVVSRNSVKPLE